MLQTKKLMSREDSYFFHQDQLHDGGGRSKQQEEG